MLFSAEDHASNPPESWEVAKVDDYRWHLRTATGEVLDTYATKRAASAAKAQGMLVELYEKEGRWYAGEQVSGWRPYAEVRAEDERRVAWLAVR